MTGIASLGGRVRMVLLTVAAALAGCGEEATRAQPAPPAVVVAPVRRGEINPSTEYVGQTVAVDTVDLRARVQAFLMQRAFKEGDDVKQGALLFVLEREPFAAAVDAAAARVAQARVVRTRRDLERTRTLYGRGNVSQRSLDRAISDKEQEEATLRAGEAQLRQTQIDLGYAQVTAPFDGRIGRSVYSVGQWVGPDSDVLATLVKLDPIYVVFNVSERSYLDYQTRVEKAVREGGPRPEFVPRLRLSNGWNTRRPGALISSTTGLTRAPAPSPCAPSFATPTSCWFRAYSSPSYCSRRSQSRLC